MHCNLVLVIQLRWISRSIRRAPTLISFILYFYNFLILWIFQTFETHFTVCWGGFKKNFKYFNRDPHSILSYGLKVENKHSLKSYIEGQFFGNSEPGFEPMTLKSLLLLGAGTLNCCFPPSCPPGNRKRAITVFPAYFFDPLKAPEGPH